MLCASSEVRGVVLTRTAAAADLIAMSHYLWGMGSGAHVVSARSPALAPQGKNIPETETSLMAVSGGYCGQRR